VDSCHVETFVYYFPRTAALVKRTTSIAFNVSADADEPPLKKLRSVANSDALSIAAVPSQWIRPGDRFYLLGLGDAAASARQCITSKGGIVDAKMTSETQFIVTTKPRTDSIVAMLLAKNSKCEVKAPKDLE
jgi:hypothetical protein